MFLRLIDSSGAVRFSLLTTEGSLKVKVNLKSSGYFVNKVTMKLILTISEVARRSGVAASALRFYEDRGLIKSERAGSGHRRYHRAVLRRVAFIVFAQRIGLNLDEIHQELEKLPTERIPTKKDWSQLSRKWLQRIDDRIKELERLRDGLTGCIGCGCLSFEQCSLSNPQDRVFRKRPGPYYWL